MGTPDEPTVFTSTTVGYPVDRSALHALEVRVGAEYALASCQVGDALLFDVDEPETDPDRATTVFRVSGHEWQEVDRCASWTDALRVLGPLLDEVMDEIPIDPINQPSPTMVIPLADGGVEIIFRTDEGVRVARELDESYDLRLEVYDKLRGSFTAATDDEASDAELRE